VISFRYHLVTIVAVFLALGLGVVAGTTVIDQGLVDRLKDQTAQANRTADQARSQRDLIQGEVDRANALAGEALPALTQDRLAGRSVVIVSDEGADGKTVDDVRRSLESAGASVTATVGMTPRMTGDDPDSHAALAELLQLPATTDARSLQLEVDARLAERLRAGAGSGDDLLVAMLDAGFLEAGAGTELRPEAGRLPGVGGPGQSVVVVSQSDPADPATGDPALLPFTQGLVRDGVPTVVGGIVPALEGSDDLVIRMRDGETPDGKPFVTVDNIDEAVGRLAMVVGLENLLRDARGGDYGFRTGRDALLPPLEP
jgi:hypothetical protein